MYQMLEPSGPLPYPFCNTSRAVDALLLDELFKQVSPEDIVGDLLQICGSLAAVVAVASDHEDISDTAVTQCLHVLAGYAASTLAIFRHWQTQAQARAESAPREGGAL